MSTRKKTTVAKKVAEKTEPVNTGQQQFENESDDHLLQKKLVEERDILLIAVAYQVLEKSSVKESCPNLIKSVFDKQHGLLSSYKFKPAY